MSIVSVCQPQSPGSVLHPTQLMFLFGSPKISHFRKSPYHVIGGSEVSEVSSDGDDGTEARGGEAERKVGGTREREGREEGLGIAWVVM